VTVFGKKEGSPSLSSCMYTPLKWERMFGYWTRLSLSLFWVILGWFPFQFSSRISRSNTNFCWILQSHCQFRNQLPNFCRCPFRNRHRKTVLLSIQKLTAKLRRCRFRNWQSNYVATDSEIGNEKLCRCWFRNQQPNCVAANSEISNEKLCRCRFRNR